MADLTPRKGQGKHGKKDDVLLSPRKGFKTVHFYGADSTSDALPAQIAIKKEPVDVPQMRSAKGTPVKGAALKKLPSFSSSDETDSDENNGNIKGLDYRRKNPSWKPGTDPGIKPPMGSSSDSDDSLTISEEEKRMFNTSDVSTSEYSDGEERDPCESEYPATKKKARKRLTNEVRALRQLQKRVKEELSDVTSGYVLIVVRITDCFKYGLFVTRVGGIENCNQFN